MSRIRITQSLLAAVIAALKCPHVIQSDQIFVFLESPMKGLLSQCGGAPPIFRPCENLWEAVEYVEAITNHWAIWRGEPLWTEAGREFFAKFTASLQAKPRF